MAKKRISDEEIDHKVQQQLALFVEHRKVFVECATNGKVYITCHVCDASNEGLWDRILRLFHLMNIELSVAYTASPEGDGVEATAENMSQYQVAILQKFVASDGIIQ